MAQLSLSDISKFCTGTLFSLFIEINNLKKIWPSFTEVLLLLVGQILNIVKIVLKCGFTATL